MSALTDRIAAEHRPLAASNGNTQGLSVRCSCGPTWYEDYTAHVAEVTEAAVRAQIATEVAQYANRDVPCWKSAAVRDVVSDSFAMAVRIAKGADR